MKAPLLAVLIVSLLLAGCSSSTAQKAAQVCRTSCDDILTRAKQVSGVYDEAVGLAARSAGAGDEVGKLLTQAEDHQDELRTLLQEQVNVRQSSAVQLTEEILSASSQSSSHLQRLAAWARENDMEIEFVTNLACAYQDAHLEAIKNNRRGITVDEIVWKLPDRYRKTPSSGWELDQQVRSFLAGIEQKKINIWDGAITLACFVSDLYPDS